MQTVKIKNLSGNALMLFKDVNIGQYFEFNACLYIKIHDNDCDDTINYNAWSITDSRLIAFYDNDNVKLISEINIEYKL